MIEITNLHKTLGVPVLSGVTLDVADGEILAIVGASGTGKSVLLKHIVGLIEPDSGDVMIDGQSVVHASYNELTLIRKRMGYVFQDAALLDSLTIRENLELAVEIDELRRRPADVEQRVVAALQAVNLDARVLDRMPGQLSGGMRKRAGVARALINEPRCILYDEPTTGLDPRNVHAMNRLIVHNRDRFGATSIVVTHDISSLRTLVDRVALLFDGRIQFNGTTEEFFDADDAAVAAYIGRTPNMNFVEDDKWQDMHAATTY